MTFKITLLLRLSGRIEADCVDELRTHVVGHHPCAVDLAEVTLVDVAAVRFLVACEAEGIELLHCSRYIREWISRERGERS